MIHAWQKIFLSLIHETKFNGTIETRENIFVESACFRSQHALNQEKQFYLQRNYNFITSSSAAVIGIWSDESISRQKSNVNK